MRDADPCTTMCLLGGRKRAARSRPITTDHDRSRRNPPRGRENMADFNLLKPLKEDYGTLQNFVDGEWVAPQTERFLPITDPARGKVIGKVPLSTTDDVEKAIDAANAAYWDWRST